MRVDENHIAFDIINQCTIDALALAYPNSKDTSVLDTDNSQISVGAELSQIQSCKEQILCKVNCWHMPRKNIAPPGKNS